MMSGEFVDYLWQMVQMVRKKYSIVEPLQLILFGDFYQLKPINDCHKRAKTKKGFCPALYLSRGFGTRSHCVLARC